MIKQTCKTKLDRFCSICNYHNQIKKMSTNEEIKKSYFEVLGLCCASEVALLERIIEPLNGVKDISVIVPTKTLIVFHDSCLLSDTQIGMNNLYIFICK